jgi:hypothetical protein
VIYCECEFCIYHVSHLFAFIHSLFHHRITRHKPPRCKTLERPTSAILDGQNETDDVAADRGHGPASLPVGSATGTRVAVLNGNNISKHNFMDGEKHSPKKQTSSKAASATAITCTFSLPLPGVPVNDINIKIKHDIHLHQLSNLNRPSALGLLSSNANAPPSTSVSTSPPLMMRQVLTTCAICLDLYKVKDEVCWSPNPSCSHAFHKDCIFDWFLLANKRNRNNNEDDLSRSLEDSIRGAPMTCPCCRHNFIFPANTSPLTDDSVNNNPHTSTNNSNSPAGTPDVVAADLATDETGAPSYNASTQDQNHREEAEGSTTSPDMAGPVSSSSAEATANPSLYNSAEEEVVVEVIEEAND